MGVSSAGVSDFAASLPKEIKKLQISYCILFFDKEIKGENLVLNLYKTQTRSFSELFNKSMILWLRKGYHLSSLNRFKEKKKQQNLYLNYNGVVDAFSSDIITGEDVFETHIRVEISADWHYKDREESVKKLYFKVINKIKGIDNDNKQTVILSLLNKYLNKINSGDEGTKDYFIQKFSELFPNVNKQP